MAGIYIHIPFCKQACHYCDFHFSTNLEIKNAMQAAIVKELNLRKNYLPGSGINSIYFGGGTPSLLEANDIASILNCIRSLYEVSNDTEITLEANPDDLNISKLLELKDIGINRLSIGIQSFKNEVLQFLNRAHNAVMAMTCVGMAKQAGIKNISIDLIYAIPNQERSAWIENIDQAIALDPAHISCYAMTIEEKTAFGNWQRKGKLLAIEEEEEAAQLEILSQKLSDAGYIRYEVSNFCKPDQYSRHNTSYWKQTPYLGIGPSAHSYNGDSRQFNIRNNHLYIKSIEKGEVPATLENLSNEDKINEYLLTGLRTIWGCDLDFLKSNYGDDLLNRKATYINMLLANKLAEVKANKIVLTQKGLLLADKISSDLFIG